MITTVKNTQSTLHNFNCVLNEFSAPLREKSTCINGLKPDGTKNIICPEICPYGK